jgi:hypothetical protein
MTIPTSLSSFLTDAVAYVSNAPDGNLPLGYREAVYVRLGPRRSEHGRRRRARLALAAARAAERVSRDEAYASDLFDRATVAAARFMSERLPHGSAPAEALWDEVAAIRTQSRAVDAATAAVLAAITATHDETFHAGSIELGKPDDINIANGDAAYFAARAIAGPATDPRSDADARRRFFLWWLQEAVPQAWLSEEEP